MSDCIKSVRSENEALRKQVLELSAQVEAMRDALTLFKQWAFDETLPTREVAEKATAALSIEPSAALQSYVNEEVAKALEEIAGRFEEEDEHPRIEGYEHTYAMRIRNIAAERRNRK